MEGRYYWHTRAMTAAEFAAAMTELASPSPNRLEVRRDTPMGRPMRDVCGATVTELAGRDPRIVIDAAELLAARGIQAYVLPVSRINTRSLGPLGGRHSRIARPAVEACCLANGSSPANARVPAMGPLTVRGFPNRDVQIGRFEIRPDRQ
jgi:hypothetical protein